MKKKHKFYLKETYTQVPDSIIPTAISFFSYALGKANNKG